MTGASGSAAASSFRYRTTSFNAALRQRICMLRCELQAAEIDHSPVSIAARLQQEGLRPPAFSTIRRILTAAGLITPEPKKRPKSSYRRFQADQPNECWQSDFTHWQLADGTGVEIINWLDDHSRYLLTSRAYRRITGQAVFGTFLAAADRYGLPQSTLTDMVRSIPLALPVAATALNTYSPVSASRRRTAIPAIPKSSAN